MIQIYKKMLILIVLVYAHCHLIRDKNLPLAVTSTMFPLAAHMPHAQTEMFSWHLREKTDYFPVGCRCCYLCCCCFLFALFAQVHLHEFPQFLRIATSEWVNRWLEKLSNFKLRGGDQMFVILAQQLDAKAPCDDLFTSLRCQ